MTAAPAQQTHPLVAFKAQLDSRMEQFTHALPAHMPAERFARVVLTAVQNNPDLLTADRQALWNACMRAAQDGLLPDGREGAIVVYNTREKDRSGSWVTVAKAQWMPMVYGIMKKARNSGQIATITARVVYAGDTYRYWIDEHGEHLLYEPSETADRNVVRSVFAMAKTKEGELLVEPLTPADIEKVRQVSRAKEKGPWVDWWEEMAKKTAIRRLSKRLPMSSDLDDLIRRDDDLYDLDAAREARKPQIVDLGAFDGKGPPPTGAPQPPPADTKTDAEIDKEIDTPPAEDVTPSPLVDSIANALLDAKTDGDVTAVAAMFGDEIAAADPPTQDTVARLLDERRKAVRQQT